MVHLGHKLFCLALVTMLALVAADGRLPYYENNNYMDRIQPGSAYDPFYPGLYPVLSRYPENQYEKLRMLFEGQDSKSGSASAMDTIFREPESKRQAVRYRQCYFNPISCFRK